jgi:phosphodiesterase/alkaline phosphatase D-like protein
VSKWTNKLDLKDLWKQREEEKIDIETLGKEVAKRIRLLPCYEKEIDTLEEIVERFESISDNDVEEFDSILADLYDWGDTPLDNNWNGRKMCWIGTF